MNGPGSWRRAGTPKPRPAEGAPASCLAAGAAGGRREPSCTPHAELLSIKSLQVAPSPILIQYVWFPRFLQTAGEKQATFSNRSPVLSDFLPETLHRSLRALSRNRAGRSLFLPRVNTYPRAPRRCVRILVSCGNIPAVKKPSPTRPPPAGGPRGLIGPPKLAVSGNPACGASRVPVGVISQGELRVLRLPPHQTHERAAFCQRS